MNTVIDICARLGVEVSDPEDFGAEADETAARQHGSPPPGLTPDQLRIWWLGYGAGWNEAQADEDARARVVLAKSQQLIDARMASQRPRLTIA